MEDKSLTVRTIDAEIAQDDLSHSVQLIHTLLDRIDQRNRRNLEDAVAIGKELHRVKEQLPHGEFGPWLQSNFVMSRTEATRYLQVADYFADKLSTMDNLPSLTVAYLIAQVSTPESVRQAALTGEIPQTVKAIKTAIEVAKKTDEEKSPGDVIPATVMKEVIDTGWLLSEVKDRFEQEPDGKMNFDDPWLQEKGQEIDKLTRKQAEQYLSVGCLLNRLKQRMPEEDVFNHAWEGYHLISLHAKVLMEYAEKYGAMPIEEVPQKITGAIAGVVVDHIRYRDKGIEAATKLMSPEVRAAHSVLWTGLILRDLFKNKSFAEVIEYAWDEFKIKATLASQYMLYADRFPDPDNELPDDVKEELVELYKQECKEIERFATLLEHRDYTMTRVINIGHTFQDAKAQLKDPEVFERWLRANYSVPMLIADKMIVYADKYHETAVDTISDEDMYEIVDTFTKYSLYSVFPHLPNEENA